MQLLNPMGLLTSLFLPVIVFLHFQKKQITEYSISNIEVWDEVIKEIEGAKRNKISKLLLLILQLLIALGIIFMLSNPVILKSFKGELLTIALDSSITMNAQEMGETRFDMAKKQINSYIDKYPEDKRYNLVLLKEKSETCLKNGTKKDIQNLLKELTPTNEPLDIEYANEFLSTIDGDILTVSDKDLSIIGDSILIGKDFENIGIIGAYYDYYEDTLLCKIKSYGNKDKSVELSIIDDKGRKDVKKIQIPKNSIGDFGFKLLGDEEKIVLNIIDEDILMEDNKYTLFLGDEYKKKVLLVGENIFLEKALESIPYIKVDTVSKWDESMNHYHIYILETEQELPSTYKNIWYMHPIDRNLNITEDTLPVSAADSEFFNGMNMKDVYIKDFYSIDEKEYIPILKAGDYTIMAYKLEDGKKRIYSTIEFTKSNFPLMPFFPIFIDNTVNWFTRDIDLHYEGNPPSQLVIGEDDEELRMCHNEQFSFREISLYDFLGFFILILLIGEWEVYRRGI